MAMTMVNPDDPYSDSSLRGTPVRELAHPGSWSAGVEVVGPGMAAANAADVSEEGNKDGQSW
ncbi:hypothetical protein PAXINDRAFT_102069 [Paxillus involutus ATCC 200175]|uniref:Unplaced genomic scaffold PAXINscaffold_92, whole genome shotgun sequence n=1 Tax=Paxillus involutus ATCC 200175 TaxID=664439 RepID=A0A0C9T3M4_PAXIN|nr:hypothetical protein PAXINDRAFT_102069 [Paxillus involutus ATCC 200175]